MISGEELIAEVVKSNDVEYSLKNPSTIVLQQTQQGVGVGLAPYMPYSSGLVFLNRRAIASEAEPDTNMVNEYNRIFGSGIQIASADVLQKL